MRINIYEEELTNDVAIVSKETEDGTYYGARFRLESSNKLDDGDESAVTFWFSDFEVAKAFGHTSRRLLETPAQTLETLRGN